MFSIKNGQLIMYSVDEKYKNYLRSYDHRVSLKENRKFYGILVTNNNVDYYVPFTSKIDKKTNPKLTINIKEKNKIIAKLLLNNMIPVNESESTIVNIDAEKYKEYYNKEIIFLRKKSVQEEILKKISNMYEVLKDEENRDYLFFKQLCCDFKQLEEKCIEYKRVQAMITELKYINIEDDLYYIYDNIKNKEQFEDCARTLDKEENKGNIKNKNINDILKIIKIEENNVD